MDANQLYIIAVCSNPVRFSSRIRLFKQFQAHMRTLGAQVIVVEAAFGHRPFEVADTTNPMHLCLRTHSEVWIKERMINLGLQHLVKIDPNYKYVAWVDADIQFTRPDILIETIHQLQHHQVVQMWSNSVDLGPGHEVISTAKSFCSYYAAGLKPGDPTKYGYWHTGYAWAARREAIDELGQLLDFAILGSSDFYMGWSMINMLDKNLYNDVASLPHRKKGFTENYIHRLFQWQERAKGIQKDLGCVSGTIQHFFHGRKTQRFYNSRENILIDNDFDPDTDIKLDSYGLWKLVLKTGRQIKLRDALRLYFRSRNEDSNDVA